MNYSAEILHLHRIPWDWFCTLTFPDVVEGKELFFNMRRACGNAPSERVQISAGVAFLRRVCSWQHLHFKRLLWTMRYEEGESTGRGHLHCLVGGVAFSSVGSRMAIREWWKNLTNAEKVDVRPYNKRLAGVDYTLKCLNIRNAYEIEKTAAAPTLLVSESCVEALTCYLMRSTRLLTSASNRFARTSSQASNRDALCADLSAGRN